MVNNSKNSITVAAKWQETLRKSGYEHHVKKRGDCRRLKVFSRIWHRIFKILHINPYIGKDLSVFELGCGGGGQLIPFALNGWRCTGLDCSDEVLKRAKNYVGEVSSICGGSQDVKLISGDILKFEPTNDLRFDIVFHVGVLEHFLNEEERIAALKKMFTLTKPGGYVISIVPSGFHPLREKMKRLKLGGYNIEEIDYNSDIMYKEFKQCGGKNIKIIAHNIFGYLLIDSTSSFAQPIKKIFYYFFQLIPVFLLPKSFTFRYASVLVGIAGK